MERNKLSGIIIPAVTPFDEKGDIRIDWMAHNLAIWGESSAAGVMVLGTNGEFRALGDDEARLVVGAAAAAKESGTLIVGVGRESTRTTIEFINSIGNQDDIDYVSVLPPHYFKSMMTSAALLQHYRDIAEASPFPVLLYVAPSYANGLVIPPAVVAELAEHPNIAGIKDTSNDQLTNYMLAAGGRNDFTVMPGTMNTMMTGLLFGSAGGVVSAANFFPDECVHVVERFKSGDREGALAEYGELRALIKATGGHRGVASVKACMNQLGFRAGVPRKPLIEASNEEIAAISEALVKAGKI